RHTRFSRDWSSDVCSSDLAAGMAREAGAGPDVAPGVAGDHFLELFGEGRQGFQAAVHVGIAQYRAAYLHAGFVTLFLVHCLAPRSEERRVGKGCSTRWCGE